MRVKLNEDGTISIGSFSFTKQLLHNMFEQPGLTPQIELVKMYNELLQHSSMLPMSAEELQEFNKIIEKEYKLWKEEQNG
jgi:hypothetical protein